MTKRDQIAALVGEEATKLAYGANTWLLRGALAVFPTAPALALIAFELHLPELWTLIGVCFLAAIACLVPGARLNRNASYAASKFLTDKERRPITVKSGGIRLGGWQIEIERAHQRLAAESAETEKQTASDLRNQQWLDSKQRRWEEYRRQHPQDPGQGG